LPGEPRRDRSGLAGRHRPAVLSAKVERFSGEAVADRAEFGAHIVGYLARCGAQPALGSKPVDYLRPKRAPASRKHPAHPYGPPPEYEGANGVQKRRSEDGRQVREYWLANDGVVHNIENRRGGERPNRTAKGDDQLRRHAEEDKAGPEDQHKGKDARN